MSETKELIRLDPSKQLALNDFEFLQTLGKGTQLDLGQDGVRHVTIRLVFSSSMKSNSEHNNIKLNNQSSIIQNKIFAVY